MIRSFFIQSGIEVLSYRKQMI